MNKVILMGRLTRDPEVRYSAGENALAIARYTLAVDRRFRRDGEASADFIQCVSFGRTPDFAAADPQPVDDNPVEPVHDHQKNRRLRIRRAEGRRAVPDADDQHQRDQHDRAERDHEALAAPHDVAVFGKAAALGLVDIRRRVKIQAVTPVVFHRALDQQEKQETIQRNLQTKQHDGGPPGDRFCPTILRPRGRGCQASRGRRGGRAFPRRRGGCSAARRRGFPCRAPSAARRARARPTARAAPARVRDGGAYRRSSRARACRRRRRAPARAAARRRAPRHMSRRGRSGGFPRRSLP